MGGLNKNQRGYIKHWLILIIIAEGFLLIFNKYLPILYLLITLLFLGGWILRLLNLYPGKSEPLILDISGACIGLVFFYLTTVFKLSNVRFLLIFVSSVIILPHLFFILANKNIK